MRESTFFQEILAEGRAAGLVEGRLEMGQAAILDALTWTSCRRCCGRR
jgi:predicted transposase YdaD